MKRTSAVRRLIAHVVVVAFVGSVVAVPSVAEAAVRESVGVVTSSDSPAEARSLARETGHAVEVSSATTATERTMALPDGTMRYESSSVPVRTETAPGEWVPIDTRLVLRDGWWQPNAVEHPVRFSAGGTDALSEVVAPNGDVVTETWPHGSLPAPIIAGSRATYSEVFPGVDLTLTATELGMASVYVVKTPEAADNEALKDLHVEVGGALLSREESGVITADVGDSSKIVASSPLWWDSSDGGDATGPGEQAAAMPVEHVLTDDGVAINVDATTSSLVPTYPIYIDPDWSSGAAAAWYTDAAYPTQSYLSAGASTELRMGTYQQNRGDAFFEFNISPLAGKQIIGAQLSTTQTAVAASPNSPAVVRTFGPRSAGFTWNQQDNGAWGPVLDTQSPGTWGGPPVTVGWNVTGGVQSRVGQANIQFGLSAQNGNLQSRRHFSRSATLIVNYNSPPDSPTDPRIDSPQRACGSWADPASIGTSEITVSVDQRDPDGGNVDTNVDLYRASGSSLVFVENKHPGLLAQGRRAVTFSGLTEGTYAWSARGSDWQADSAGTSGWCFFAVDTTAPPAPTASSSATSFTVGAPVSVTVASTSDAAGYIYWLAYSALTPTVPTVPVSIARQQPLPDCARREGAVRYACASGSTATTLTVAPVDALSTLWVAAYDRAGNMSAPRGVKLYASTGTPAARDSRINSGHGWLTTAMIDPLPTAIPDANAASAVALTLPDSSAVWQGVDEVKPGIMVPVLKTSIPADASKKIMTSALVDTTDSFSFAMWVRPSAPTVRSIQVIAHQWSGESGVSLSLQSGKYTLCRAGKASSSEDSSLISTCVQAPTATAANQWTLVTGIWDRVNQQLRIDIGSSATPAQVSPNVRGSGETWGQAGEFALGPPPTEWRFEGMIANPVIAPGVLDSRQLSSLAALQSPFTS